MISSSTTPLLKIKGLHTRFHTMEGIVEAVDGLDMHVVEGETLGLVGESGCGKSVTALSILQLLLCPPAEILGEIRFNDQSLLELHPDKVRKVRGKAISMVFQEPMTSLNPVYTIGEQIAESIRLHEAKSRPEAWKRAVEALDMVGMPSPRNRAGEYPHMLSGGMRQRAMIAMALSCNPKLLIADEPTTALDVTTQAQIIDLMGQLKEKIGTSIILITHDLGVIAEMASRVVVMYAGRVVEEAPVRELFKDPLHPYTKGLLGSVPVIGRKGPKGRKLQEIPGIVPRLLDLPEGCRFNPRCKEAREVCRVQNPPSVRIGESRRVECWLHAEKGR